MMKKENTIKIACSAPFNDSSIEWTSRYGLQ
jgi:hypothetical protein